MKLDALRGINSFIQFQAERPRFSNSEVSGIWQEALPQFSFMDPILRNFSPNYLALHSPNIHCYFSPLCFYSWYFTHQKMFSPSLLSSMLALPIPQDSDQSQSWQAFPEYLSEMISPFSELPQQWFWEHQLQKFTIIRIFTNTRKSCGNVPTVSLNLFCHS